MSGGVEARVLAAQTVHAVLFEGRSLKAVLNELLPSVNDTRDRALIEAIVMAVIRNRNTYQQTLDRMMPRPLGRRDADLRALLYAGMAQLDGMGLPAHASLATTVDAARAIGRAHQAGMVNAILRRVQREGVLALDPAVEWPPFLAERVRRDWPAEAAEIFRQSALQAPMFLRVNARKSTCEEYLAKLQEAGVAARAVPGFANAIELGESVPVSALPGFREGWVSVQDLSAQAASALIDSGGSVLDACAAPGGKTAALLETGTPIELTALDSNARRLKQVETNLQRLELLGDHVKLQVADAATVQLGGAFDAILLDVPCSATGVVRRQPDVLLHRRRKDIDSLVALQAAILGNAWGQLKAGGTLLYCTCSILAAENSRQVADFLRAHADVECVRLTQPGYGVACEVDGRYAGQQRLTGDLGADGFFYAVLRKTA